MEQIKSKSTYKGFEVETGHFVKVNSLTEGAIKDGVITLYGYKPETNKITACKLDCKLRNIRNSYQLAMAIGKKWYEDALNNAREQERTLQERKEGENPLSEEEISILANLKAWIDDLKAVTCYEKAETLGKFEELVYFARAKHGNLPSIISDAAKSIISARKNAETPKAKEFKEAVETFVSLLSTNEEGNTLAFRFNANTRLLTEVYSTSYKARALNKDGRVRSGKLSEKSAAMEILLACIEELQRKQAEKVEREQKETEKG